MGMKTPNYEQRLKDLIEAYQAGKDEEEVSCAYLFGSQALGTATSTSDIDLAILYEHEPPSTLMGSGQKLASYLERGLKKEVDLIVLNTASAELVHEVLESGKLVIDRDPALRVRFEVKKRNEYFDMLPILQEYRGSKKEAA